MADDDESRLAEALVHGVTEIATAFLRHTPLKRGELTSLLRAITKELSAAAMIQAPNSEAVRAAVAVASPAFAPAAADEPTAPTEESTPAEAPADTAEAPPEDQPKASAEPDELPAETEEAAVDGEESPDEPGPSPLDRWEHLSRTPAVPIWRSVTDNAIICLFDGVPKKMLKRYIRAKYGMEEHEYKAWFGLPDDYPMVAPGYAAQKAVVAIAQGLGTSKISKAPRQAPASEDEDIPAGSSETGA